MAGGTIRTCLDGSLALSTLDLDGSKPTRFPASHLAQLCKGLHALVSEPAEAGATLAGPSGTQRYGVFIDYCCLFQHPDPAAGVYRTEAEDAKFKEGLGALSGLY